jgi:hypothetical protein
MDGGRAASFVMSSPKAGGKKAKVEPRGSVAWPTTISLPTRIRVRDLPRASRIIITVRADGANGPALAWAGVTLFNYQKALITGSVTLRVFRGPCRSPVAAHMDNVYATAAATGTITLAFGAPFPGKAVVFSDHMAGADAGRTAPAAGPSGAFGMFAMVAKQAAAQASGSTVNVGPAPPGRGLASVVSRVMSSRAIASGSPGGDAGGLSRANSMATMKSPEAPHGLQAVFLPAAMLAASGSGASSSGSGGSFSFATTIRSTDMPGVPESVRAIILQDPLDHMSDEERGRVWGARTLLTPFARALPKFVLSVPWGSRDAVQEAYALLSTWAQPSATEALQLLDEQFPDPKVRAFAVACLEPVPDDQLAVLTLQLAQVCVRDRCPSRVPHSSASSPTPPP